MKWLTAEEKTNDPDLDDGDNANDSSSPKAIVTTKEALHLYKMKLSVACNDEQISLQKVVTSKISALVEKKAIVNYRFLLKNRLVTSIVVVASFFYHLLLKTFK